MANCPECGSDSAQGRFCGRCGAALGAGEERVSLSAIGVRSPVARWVPWVATATVLSVLGAGLFWFASGDEPTSHTDTPEAEPSRVRIGIPQASADAGPPDAGGATVPAAGTHEEVAPDAGPPDAGPPDAGRRRPAVPGPRAAAPSPRPSPRPRPRPQPSPAPAPSTASPQVYLASARAHVAHTYRAQIQGCFDSAARAHPGLSGVVIISMVPHADGRVAASRVVSNTTAAPEIGTCLTQAARTWTLPTPPRRTLEVRLRYRL